MSEPSHETVHGGAETATLERAEEMVDRAGERVGELAVQLGHKLRVFAARAREEAEDIWAEAQSRRRPDE